MSKTTKKRTIKDYLHLYFRCHGVVSDSKDVLIINGDSALTAELFYAIWRGDCKFIPYLRPISDMTIPEADHFAWLCLDSEHHFDKDARITPHEIEVELVHNDNGLLLDEDIEIYMGVNARCFDGYVLIMKDGRIAVCSDEKLSKLEPVDNVAEKIRYLLEKRFDLFGLIKAGLAIDLTTVPQYNQEKQANAH